MTDGGPCSADLLAIYLNDHLAGATGGLELFRRAAGAQQGSALGEHLQRLTAEVVQDRRSLLAIMRTLGAPIRHYKAWLGWGAEKLGRLKLNGSLTSRSPLSTVVELEGMRLGVEGKAACWRTLTELRDARLDQAQLGDLLARAERQIDVLERLRLAAAATVFR